MKYLLASLVAGCLIGGMLSANERGSGGLSDNCPPSCPSQGPQGPGAQKGDRQPIHAFPRTQKESSNFEKDENAISTEKSWSPVAR